MMSMSCRLRHRSTVSTTYTVTDRLHRDRSVQVTADEIMTTVGDWLAQLGVHSPLAEDLSRTVRDGDWPAVHALSELLSVDVTVAA